MRALARDAPGLRCELVEAEPEQSLPALALGDVDLVLADEWQHQPHARPAGGGPPRPAPRPGPRRPARRTIRVARAAASAVPLSELAGRGLDDRPPRHGLGGDDATARAASSAASTPTSATAPTTPSSASALVAQGQAVTLLPDFVAPRPTPAWSCARSPSGSRAPHDLRRHPRGRRAAPVRPRAARRRPRRRGRRRLATAQGDGLVSLAVTGGAAGGAAPGSSCVA